MFSFLLNPLYKIGAILVVIFSVLATIYGKGRADASANAKIAGYKETQDAIEKATRARSRSDAADPKRLHDNDGYRRD